MGTHVLVIARSNRRNSLYPQSFSFPMALGPANGDFSAGDADLSYTCNVE